MKFNWKKLLSILVPVLVEISLPILDDVLNKINHDPNDPTAIKSPAETDTSGPRMVPWWEDRQ